MVSDLINEKLDHLLQENKGILRTADALQAGVSKPQFYRYAQQKGLERVAHGIYLAKDAWMDGMYLISLRAKQGIFSHETALFLHDLTDREPSQYSVTVKTGYNPSYLTDEGVKVYTVKPSLHELGRIHGSTQFGRRVPVYDMERTICDIVRSRSRIEGQTIQDALKQYARRKDKNLGALMRYAEVFRVEKILRTYLEVLL